MARRMRCITSEARAMLTAAAAAGHDRVTVIIGPHPFDGALDDGGRSRGPSARTLGGAACPRSPSAMLFEVDR